MYYIVEQFTMVLIGFISVVIISKGNEYGNIIYSSIGIFLFAYSLFEFVTNYMAMYDIKHGIYDDNE